ncbi:MAG: hypothetical protein JWQ32_260 [Marmoricola sp.]|nr:hypothetical protein [Marmoricola sp.]
MSWTETHRRWQVLQEIEALANAGCDELPWNDEYAAVFGDRDQLAAALQYRWELNRTTQLDTHLPEQVLEQQRTRLVARNAGVLRLLRRHESGPRPPLRVVADRDDSCSGETGRVSA